MIKKYVLNHDDVEAAVKAWVRTIDPDASSVKFTVVLIDCDGDDLGTVGAEVSEDLDEG